MAHTHLDAAAGAPLHPAAREVLDAALARGYADPRALHGPGRDARLLLDNAREAVADALGVRAAPTAAVACQLANHEVGTLQPAGSLALSDGAPLFVDGSASLGLLDLPDAPWAVVAGAATSWGGPVGIGVLVVRRGTRWTNPFPGDPEPQDFAGALPDVAGALAAAAALQATLAERAEVDARRRRLVDRVREVAAGLPDTEVVGDPVDRLPHLVTFSCLYLSGEALVRELDRAGFGVASGSACTASTLEPSHVLASMGALTHGNVRISLGRDATDQQVEDLLGVLPDVVGRLRSEVGL